MCERSLPLATTHRSPRQHQICFDMLGAMPTRAGRPPGPPAGRRGHGDLGRMATQGSGHGTHQFNFEAPLASQLLIQQRAIAIIGVTGTTGVMARCVKCIDSQPQNLFAKHEVAGIRRTLNGRESRLDVAGRRGEIRRGTWLLVCWRSVNINEPLRRFAKRQDRAQAERHQQHCGGGTRPKNSAKMKTAIRLSRCRARRVGSTRRAGQIHQPVAIDAARRGNQ